jgi:hypothetical protein
MQEQQVFLLLALDGDLAIAQRHLEILGVEAGEFRGDLLDPVLLDNVLRW